MQTWEQIRKAGIEAPQIESIEQIIMGGGDETNMMMTREELQQKIVEYFQSKISLVEDEETGGTVSIWRSAPTKSELAAKLGISTATLARYNRGEYAGGRQYQGLTREKIAPEDFPLIQKAMLIIADFYERQLSLNKNNSGCIFWLLNSENEKWSNQQDVRIEKMEEIKVIPLEQRIKQSGLVWDEETQEFLPETEERSVDN